MTALTPRSTAVMASRKSPMKALDFFPTPPWAVRALIALLRERNYLVGYGADYSCWEPACGAGHAAIPLRETFGRVFASDIHDWGYGDRRDLDFTSFATAADAGIGEIDWIITNPPFKAAEAFLDNGLRIARSGVALLLRLQFLEGGGRFERVFGTDRRPAIVAPFAERVPMIEGAWDPEAKSATAYAWFIWTPRPVAESVVVPIRPGAARRHTLLSDRALATPGEAARRRAALKATKAAA